MLAVALAARASVVFGVSMALGAFLAGMVVGQSEFSARAGALQRSPRVRRWLESQPMAATPREVREPRHSAIVVGYGHIGQSVARLLSKRGIAPTILEMNIETYHRLRQHGIEAVFGDANQKPVLEAAGAANEVYAGEGEVTLAMTSSILSRLGATPEQLDQERERIRLELVRAISAEPESSRQVDLR